MRNRRFRALLALPLLLAAPAFGAAECNDPAGCDVEAHAKAEAGEALTHGEVGAALLDALDKNPELRQQLAKLITKGMQENQQADHVAALDRVLHDPAAPFVGNKDGKVVIVEYFDNRCPYCKALAPLLARAVTENLDLKVVYKEYAILGPQSQVIARAALAAQKQGKYAAFHDEFMRDPTEEKDTVTEAHIFEMAEKAGLDIKTLRADMGSQETIARLNDLNSEGRMIGMVSVTAGVTSEQFKATGKIIDETKTYETIRAFIAGARAAHDKTA